MDQYLRLLGDVLANGDDVLDRTGVGTRRVFGRQLRFNLDDGFPALTTKRLHISSIIHELLWFISGSTNIGYLKRNNITIWNEWADGHGDLGPVYGKQWRDAGATCFLNGIDQLGKVIYEIQVNPESRRLVVSAWGAKDIASMALPPCHCLFQFHVAKGRLSCQVYQRSADIFLGLPFNIASYALLTMMVAQVCNLEPGEVVFSIGDAHLYLNHLDQARAQLKRKPKILPLMIIDRRVKDIDRFEFDDFTLDGYYPEPAIPAPVAV